MAKTPLRNRLIVAVFLVAWGAGQAISVWDTVQGNDPGWSLFVSSAPSAEDYPRVDSDMRFDADGRWAPTLMRGDELLRVNDIDLRGASNAAVTRTLRTALRDDGEAALESRRDDRRSVEIYRSETLPDWLILFGLPLSIACAIAAAMLLLRAPHWQLSGLGFVLFASVSIFALGSGLPPMPIGPAEALQFVIRPFCGAVAILIAARFPDSPPPTKRWDLALAAVTFVVAAGLYTVLSFGPFRGFVYGAAALVVGFGATMSFLLVRTSRSVDPIGRRQIRWFLYGAFVALGALVFGNLAFLISPPLLLLSAIPMSLAFAAVPIGFLIAVFGSRFLDADPLISSSTSYFLLGLALLVGIETLIPQIAAAASSLVGVTPGNTELALAIAMVFLAIPVHRSIRPRIERVFFPERLALEDGIHELLEEISEIEGRDQMIEHVGSRLASCLNTRTCIVFGMARTDYEAQYSLGATEAPALSAESTLVATLRERSAPLAADRLSRRDRIGQLPPEERAILSDLAVSVVVPIRARGRLLGFVCLGTKRSGDIYTSTELALLTAVANVVSVRFSLVD